MATGVIGLMLLSLLQASGARSTLTTFLNAAQSEDKATFERVSMLEWGYWRENINVQAWTFIDENEVQVTQASTDSIKIWLERAAAFTELQESLPEPQTLRDARWEHDRKGLYVIAVLPGSNAEEAGLKIGDVILKYNDKPVNRIQELLDERIAAQGNVALKIKRGGNLLEKSIPSGQLGCHVVELMTDVSNQRWNFVQYTNAKIKQAAGSLGELQLAGRGIPYTDKVLKKSLGYSSLADLPSNATLILYDQYLEVQITMDTWIEGLRIKPYYYLSASRVDLKSSSGTKTGKWLVNYVSNPHFN